MEFRDKIILITGASKGLGKSLAEQFALFGANLILVARSEDQLKELCETLRQNECKCAYFKADMTQQADIDRLFQFVKTNYGFVDVLINNAGILKTWGFNNGTFEQFQQIMDLNVNGYMRVLLTFHPIIGRSMEGKNAKYKRGLVIIISSTGGVVMTPNLQFYCISKAATNMIARAIRTEFRLEGQKYLKVMNVNPPQFDTEIYEGTELSEWVKALRLKNSIPTADDFAKLIVKGAKKEEKNLNLTTVGKMGWMGRIYPEMFDKFAVKFYFRQQKANPSN